MKSLIVSTVGTSLLTKGSSGEETALLRSTANHTEAGLPANKKAQVIALVQDRQKRLASANLEQASGFSAELNGVLSYYDGQLDRGRADHHILLTTDTYQGRKAGESVEAWLRTHDIVAENRALDALAANDLLAFRQGVAALVTFCEDEVTQWRANGYRVVFNLVGGFKAVQAYAQSLGMIYADEQFYLFEAVGSPLLRIPRLPMTFDLAGVVRANFATMRRMSLQLPVDVNATSALPESMLEPLSDHPALSVWGEVAWKKHHAEHYEAELLSPPSDRIVFADGFAASCRGLSADRLRHVNTTIDQLSRYQASNGKENPPSLGLKALRGNPVPNATHEADAWHDQDAKRLFLRFEGSHLIVVKLAPGLH